jgi:hypothetical protein
MVPRNLADMAISGALAVGGTMYSSIGPDESVSLTIGALVLLCGLVWRAATRLTKIEDSLEQVNHRLNSLECNRGDRGDCKK